MKVVTTISPRDYDAVLFDLDGVLTRTASVHASAWKKLFDGFLQQRTIAVALGAGVYEARQASTLRDRFGGFQQQLAPLFAQIQQLERERSEATNNLALLTGQK
jgi:beta-phosphoglucomutase-like phosphatase (HAD superfamily)